MAEAMAEGLAGSGSCLLAALLVPGVDSR